MTYFSFIWVSSNIVGFLWIVFTLIMLDMADLKKMKPYKFVSLKQVKLVLKRRYIPQTIPWLVVHFAVSSWKTLFFFYAWKCQFAKNAEFSVNIIKMAICLG